MTYENPKFKKMINWKIRAEDKGYNSTLLRLWLLERVKYEVIIKNNTYGLDLRDIEEQVEGKWAAFRIVEMSDKNYSHYFFELETDAMAFKLRWI